MSHLNYKPGYILWANDETDLCRSNQFQNLKEQTTQRRHF